MKLPGCTTEVFPNVFGKLNNCKEIAYTKTETHLFKFLTKMTWKFKCSVAEIVVQNDYRWLDVQCRGSLRGILHVPSQLSCSLVLDPSY